MARAAEAAVIAALVGLVAVGAFWFIDAATSAPEDYRPSRCASLGGAECIAAMQDRGAF